MIPAFIFGEASGASFNPALTIALAVGGMFDWALVPGYIIAQILGGIVGGGFCGGAAGIGRGGVSGRCCGRAGGT